MALRRKLRGFFVGAHWGDDVGVSKRPEKLYSIGLWVIWVIIIVLYV